MLKLWKLFTIFDKLFFKIFKLSNDVEIQEYETINSKVSKMYDNVIVLSLMLSPSQKKTLGK